MEQGESLQKLLPTDEKKCSHLNNGHVKTTRTSNVKQVLLEIEAIRNSLPLQLKRT